MCAQKIICIWSKMFYTLQYILHIKDELSMSINETKFLIWIAEYFYVIWYNFILFVVV